MTEPNQEWEKEFDERFAWIFSDEGQRLDDEQEEVKAFIRSLLLSERQRITKELVYKHAAEGANWDQRELMLKAEVKAEAKRVAEALVGSVPPLDPCTCEYGGTFRSCECESRNDGTRAARQALIEKCKSLGIEIKQHAKV
jgi:hypothetical protein